MSSEEIDSWKSEYDSQVDAWRAESAVARDKAEKERERWEAARAKEAKEAPPASDMSGWETLGSKSAPSASASVSDARDLVAGEKQVCALLLDAHRSLTVANVQRAGPSQSQVSGDEAAKWDHVTSSLSSSFPSMTFPEHGEEEDASLPPAQKSRQAPLFATLAIFDSSLSTRTRVKALFASLAINLVLPFINGVMLGFGEIFAKNIVLEWWRPGSIATQAGIRGRRRS